MLLVIGGMNGAGKAMERRRDIAEDRRVRQALKQASVGSADGTVKVAGGW
ncbi:hypothetical protein [Agrobacterium rosae]|nr:hypothetical protein [Agrobacterium rosae]